jgi:hypothetical protein
MQKSHKVQVYDRRQVTAYVCVSSLESIRLAFYVSENQQDLKTTLHAKFHIM